MATTLREVLNTFQNARAPLSLAQMARDLDLPAGMVEGMIEHWVRKGKIREVTGAAACGSCSSTKHCGYVPNLPRSYELVRDDDPATDVPMCKCCGSGNPAS